MLCMNINDVLWPLLEITLPPLDHPSKKFLELPQENQQSRGRWEMALKYGKNTKKNRSADGLMMRKQFSENIVFKKNI